MLKWVGATSAADLDLSINGEAARLKQEKLAEAFEKYLMEGKAPSTNLQSAFAQFAAWLKQIYNMALGLDIKIDDDIRQVFDRMLATDEQIAEIKDRNKLSLPGIKEVMNKEERDAFTELERQSNEIDAAEASRLKAEAEARENQDWWLKEKAKVEARIEKDFWEKPEYRALWFLTRGEFKTGTTPPNLKNRRLSKTALKEMGLTQADLDNLPRHKRRIYTDDEETATDPSVLSLMLGFEDAREMIDVLTGMENIKDAAAYHAEIEMKSLHGDPLNDGTVENLMEESVFNDTRRAAIQVELDTLARAAGTAKISRAVTKTMVDQILSEMTADELMKPAKYNSAARREAIAADRAAREKDYVKALEHKRRHLINHELYRQLLKSRDQIEKINTYLNRMQKKKIDPKKVDPNFVTQIKNLLNFYEVGSMSLTKFEDSEINVAAAEVMMYIREQQAKGEPVILPGDLVEFNGTDSNGDPMYAFKVKHWRQMTMPELKALRDMVKNLEKRGRVNSSEAKEERKARAENLAFNIRSKTKSRREKKSDLARPTRQEQEKIAKSYGFFAAHRKLESMLRQLDGFEEQGPMWTAIFDGLAEAQNSKTIMVENLVANFEDLFDKFTKTQRHNFSTEKSAVAIEALGGKRLTHEQRLMIAVNWGNESSREAILDDGMMIDRFGDAWNEEAIQEILETLTDVDLDVVTKIWGIADAFWSDISALEMKHTGVSPAKVEAASFEVNGRTMTGGYYPLKYDDLGDDRAQRENEQSVMDKVKSGGFSRAHTSHGFTINRVGSGGRPVRLDIGTLMRHMDEVTQDISYRDAITQAADVIAQPAVRDAIKDVMGATYLKAVEEILVKVAAGNMAGSNSWVDKSILRNSRVNITTALMGWNLRTILTQPMGLTQTMARLGTIRTMQGCAEFWMNPTRMPEKIREINQKSPYMAKRASMLTREIDDMVNKIDRRKFSDKVREVGYKPMVFTDVVSVAYPTWIAAEAKAMAGDVDGIEANDQAAAIKYADSVVRLTQGSGGAQNLSMVQQSSELMKLMTMFYGYFNTTYNMEAEAWAQAKQMGAVKGSAHFVAQTMILSIIPAIISGLVLQAWPDDDDIAEDGAEVAWAKWGLIQLLNYTTGQLVGIRDIGSALTSGFDFSITPVNSFGKMIGNLGKDIYELFDQFAEGEMPDAFGPEVKNLIRVIAYATGAPGVNQLIRSVDYAIKEAEGDLKNPPENVIEYGRGLLLTGDK